MFGFSKVLGGLGGFRKVREANRKNYLLFSSKSDLMVPSCDQNTEKVHHYYIHNYQSSSINNDCIMINPCMHSWDCSLSARKLGIDVWTLARPYTCDICLPVCECYCMFACKHVHFLTVFYWCQWHLICSYIFICFSHIFCTAYFRPGAILTYWAESFRIH